MKYNKQHAAVCGLFCPACTIFIATQEDPEHLKYLANQFDLQPEKMRCYGCRSEQRIPYCDTCKLYSCTQEKGIDFCGECDIYPCNDLREFQAAGAHRFELWEAQKYIQKKGYEKWMEEMIPYYSCPKCGKINSAYDFKCRTCENTPSNQYIKKHSKRIRKFLKNQQTRLKID